MTKSDLRITVVSPVAELGGAESFLLDILAGLQGRGVSVNLLVLGSGPLLAAAMSRGIPAHSSSSLSLRNPASIARAFRTIRRECRAGQPDVVLASHAKGQIMTSLACAGMAPPRVTQLYDPPSKTAARDRLASRLPGLRIAITPETAEAHRSMNPALHLLVIPPATDAARLLRDAAAGDPDRAWVEERLGDDGPRVVMVARLQRFKGPFDFLVAAKEIHASLPDTRFLLVGPDSPIEPGLRGELRREIAESGLSGFVGLAGRLSRTDLAATVRGATLLLHPAHREPFGLAVVEALLLGTPVIAYDAPGPRWILQAGGGALVPRGDTRALSMAVVHALDDSGLIERWRRESVVAGSRFDLGKVVDRYYEVLGQTARFTKGPRVTSVGAVPPGPSGVHDYGTILSRALRDRGFATTDLWFLNRADRIGDACAVSRKMLRQAFSVRAGDAVLWHYSPVAHGYHGIPMPGICMGILLRARRIRVVTVLHELAYTYRPGTDGFKGRVKALAQKLALRVVLAGSSAVVVTTEQRRRSLEAIGRGHRIPAIVVPVFPTVTPANGASSPAASGFTLGVPGFSGDGVRPDLLLDAVAELPARIRCRIVLLGAPGGNSSAGDAWSRLARDRGIGDLLEFTGILEPQDLSRFFQVCHAIVLVNEEGPSSRKTTLANALAHGLPIVSLNGPNRWNELVDSGAIRVASADASTLRMALVELHDAADLRSSLGIRGRAFGVRYMSLAGAADVIYELLDRGGTTPRQREGTQQRA